MNSGLDRVKCGETIYSSVKWGNNANLMEVEPRWKCFVPVQVVGFLMEGGGKRGGGASRSLA